MKCNTISEDDDCSQWDRYRFPKAWRSYVMCPLKSRNTSRIFRSICNHLEVSRMIWIIWNYLGFCLHVSGNNWSKWSEASVGICAHLGPPGVIRKYLEVFATAPEHLDLCVTIWNPMGSSGIIINGSGWICKPLESCRLLTKLGGIWNHYEESWTIPENLSSPKDFTR